MNKRRRYKAKARRRANRIWRETFGVVPVQQVPYGEYRKMWEAAQTMPVPVLTDDQLGISIRFVRQYDIKADFDFSRWPKTEVIEATLREDLRSK